MIELPKDAEGREIPLDVDALYDKNGERLAIYAWEYMPKLKHSKWRVRFLFDNSGVKYYPDEYFLTPPDSWEKLEEDLGRAAERKDITSQCRYFNNTNRCANCPISKVGGCTHKDERAFRDILDRIRKLRGEEQ
nr:MAG TPA: hypothetical protein [Caudoviricetes sp.]